MAKGLHRYVLRSPFIGSGFERALAKEDFAELKAAKDVLLQYMSLEEGVIQTLYAFQDWERLLLESGLENYLFPDRDFNFMQDARVRANVRVSAFLNAITSLRDQAPKFRELLPQRDVRQTFIQKWEREKDSSVAFRFCERLRNYAQHQTQPVSGVTTGGEWNAERTLLEKRVSVFVAVEEVCQHRNIKSTEKQAYIDEFGARCDVSLIFRETVGRVGQIVTEMRDETQTDFEERVEVYERALKILREENSEIPIAEAACLSSDRAEVEKFSIFPDFVERARKLRKTYLMRNNEEHYISNRARGHSAS